LFWEARLAFLLNNPCWLTSGYSETQTLPLLCLLFTLGDGKYLKSQNAKEGKQDLKGFLRFWKGEGALVNQDKLL
jgi:hypothetical protein